MTLSEHLCDPTFRLRIDEDLRHRAVRAVELYFRDNAGPHTARSQVHAITGILLGGGISELRELAHKQANKRTNDRDHPFWSFVESLVKEGKSPKKELENARIPVEGMLEELGLLAGSKNDLRQDRHTLWESMAPVYFEHFVCHYFYMKPRQEREK